MSLCGKQRVKLCRFGTEWRVRACRLRRILRQFQILEHQRGREAAGVFAIGRRSWYRARDGAIGRKRPRLTRRCRHDVKKLLGIETEFLTQCKGLAGADHRNAKHHVVADLGGLPCARAAGMSDFLTHFCKDRLRALKRSVTGAAHDGERSGFCATRAAGDRRVDEVDPAFSAAA